MVGGLGGRRRRRWIRFSFRKSVSLRETRNSLGAITITLPWTRLSQCKVQTGKLLRQFDVFSKCQKFPADYNRVLSQWIMNALKRHIACFLQNANAKVYRNHKFQRIRLDNKCMLLDRIKIHLKRRYFVRIVVIYYTCVMWGNYEFLFINI